MRTEFDHGGSATIRLSTDDDAVEVRRGTARDVRTKVAAAVVRRHGGLAAVKRSKDLQRAAAAEFAELCAMLGLDTSTKQVGICARPGCGNELSLTGASAGSGGGGNILHRKKGFCSRRCMKLANLKNTEATP